MAKRDRTETPQEHVVPHARNTCAFCKNFHDFELPDQLLSELTKRRLVVFAGAGVTTESRLMLPYTLHDEVRRELGVVDTDLSFSKTMTRYVEQPDGRRKLLEKIQARFRYFKSFPELYSSASRFHRELSTLFYVDTYITTNWDDYFENECGATPLVTGEDFVLWNLDGRKVVKIHGSIWNPGSIVATEADYKRAHTQLKKGALGALLKTLLATKTVVYVGYSFSDDDFLQIHQALRRDLGSAFPVAYVVTLDREHEREFRALGLVPIFTDGAYFVATLKRHIATDNHFLPDARFDAIPKAYARVMAARKRLHRRYRLRERPEVLYAAQYQDGLAHAFERIGAMRSHGEYSHKCDVIERAKKYGKLRSLAIRKRRYTDVAYIDGYFHGLIYLVAPDDLRKALPLYYVYGLPQQPSTLEAYAKALAKGPQHARAVAYAKRTVEMRLGNSEILMHPPHLEGLYD